MTSTPDSTGTMAASRQVVLFGVSQYQSEDLQDVPAVARVIHDLSGLLSDQERSSFSEANISVVDDSVTPADAVRTLRRAATHADDVLFVYFIGHGEVSGAHRELYLTCHAYDRNAPEQTGVRYGQIREIVLQSAARTKIVILDCCFSGTALGTPLATDDEVVLGIEGTYVIASSSAHEHSFFKEHEDHTVFSGHVIQSLQDGVSSSAEFISLDGLYRQLRTRLVAEDYPEPQKRGTQSAGDFKLFRNRRYSPSPAEALRRELSDAHAAACKGDWPGAKQQIDRVWAEQRRLFGDEAREVLITQMELGYATGAAGDPRAGSALIEPALRALTVSLPPDHAAMLRGRTLAAVCRGESGDLPTAIAELRRLSWDVFLYRGPADEFAASLQRLAYFLGVAGDYAEAARILEVAESIVYSARGGENGALQRIREDKLWIAEQMTLKGETHV